MTSMRGSLGRPLWFEMNVTELDDTRVMMLISKLGAEGYGIHVALRLFLAQQPLYRAPMSITMALALRCGTTQSKLEDVIKDFQLYIIEYENGQIFFSPELTSKLEKFDKKCLENKEKGEISAKKREVERKEKLKNLQLTLSDLDSTQPRFNCGSTEEKENKEKKEKKRNFAKQQLIDKYNNSSAEWGGVAGYSSLSIVNGCLHNNVSGEYLGEEDSILVWDLLVNFYLNQQKER